MWRQIIGFSPPTSTFGGIGIQDTKPETGVRCSSPWVPRHSEQRNTVAPMFQPQNLEPARYSTICRVTRRSTGSIASPLKLTTQMLATLFDFPWEERRKLTRWSDVATAAPGDRAVIASEAARMAELEECGAYFAELWKERINQP